ncbi:MAG: hypothetical protein AAGA60_19520, partial [Cyanobacteria bacterium P01_E01_bin.42]
MGRAIAQSKFIAMQVNLSATSLEGLRTEYEEQLGVRWQTDGLETILEFPPQIGRGELRQIQLRSGLTIILKNAYFLESVDVQIPDIESEILAFRSSLSGRAKATFCGRPEEYYITPKQSRIAFFPSLGGSIESQPHQRIVQVEVTAERESFNELIADRVDLLPQEFRDVLAGKRRDPLVQTQILSDVAIRAAEQILHCPYQGLTRRLYLESRAIELIALHLHGNYMASSASFKSDEIDRIHYAKEILLSNLENPPSLLELSRKVGLNDCKLKRGFRQVFGMTAFSCLY